jgi:hypothetical protein
MGFSFDIPFSISPAGKGCMLCGVFVFYFMAISMGLYIYVIAFLEDVYIISSIHRSIHYTEIL